MRYLILSDIHGSLPPLRQVLSFYRRGQYDLLLLLGDLLNYGPRNGLPEGLDAMGVAEALREVASDVVAVRGNCDSEVDQMLLPFPIMSDFQLVCDGNRRIVLSHGHLYSPSHMPQGTNADLFLYGHTHVHVLRPATLTSPAVCNPGSITFPKKGQPPTFATLSDGVLSLHLLNGNVIDQLRIY